MTTKDLGLINEQLNQVAMACKKSSTYASYFQDAALKQMATDIANHQKTHYQNLLNYLNAQ